MVGSFGRLRLRGGTLLLSALAAYGCAPTSDSPPAATMIILSVLPDLGPVDVEPGEGASFVVVASADPDAPEFAWTLDAVVVAAHDEALDQDGSRSSVLELDNTSFREGSVVLCDISASGLSEQARWDLHLLQ